MKKTLLTIIIILIGYSGYQACTSFAVYGNKVYYGMNLDYPNSVLTFSIQERGGTKYFKGCFNEYYTFAGMNERGLFTNQQMLYPRVPGNNNPGPLDLFYGELFEISLVDFPSASDVRMFLTLSDRLLQQYTHITLHEMVADKYSAFVAEPGDSINHCTAMQDSLLVMSNFANYKFEGQPYTAVSGVGASRYKELYKYVKANKDSFSVLKGFEGLSKCRQGSGSFATLTSLVCDPDSNFVYISLKGSFNKIWRVRLDDQIIETWSGFDTYYAFNIDSDGITSTELNSVSAIAGSDNKIPETFQLNQNYPNPFNPNTSISFTVPVEQNINLRVYDNLGRYVTTLTSGERQAGYHTVNWNGEDESGRKVSSGVYFYALQTESGVTSRKMILMK